MFRVPVLFEKLDLLKDACAEVSDDVYVAYCQADKEIGLLGVSRFFRPDVLAVLSGRGSGVFEDEEGLLFFLRNIEKTPRAF
jgi:hypothetical protein